MRKRTLRKALKRIADSDGVISTGTSSMVVPLYARMVLKGMIKPNGTSTTKIKSPKKVAPKGRKRDEVVRPNERDVDAT